MDELIKRLKSWKTTIVGVATAISAVLVILGVLTPENTGVEDIKALMEAVLVGLASVSGLILAFTKDPGTD